MLIRAEQIESCAPGLLMAAGLIKIGCDGRLLKWEIKCKAAADYQPRGVFLQPPRLSYTTTLSPPTRLCHDRPNLVLRLGVLGSQSVSDALSATLVSASAVCDATLERSPDARTPVSSDRSRLNIVPLYMQIYTHPFAKIKCIVLRGHEVVIRFFFIPPMTIFLADSKCKHICHFAANVCPHLGTDLHASCGRTVRPGDLDQT